MVQASNENGLPDANPFTFTVQTVVRNKPPSLERKPSDVFISINKPKLTKDFWMLPKIEDDEVNSKKTISIQLGAAQSFVQFDPEINSF